MKRLRTITKTVTAIVVSSLLVLSPAYASASTLIKDGLYTKENMTISINGEQLPLTEPILNKHGHTLLPMRVLYEALDAKVDWKKESQTASATRNGITMQLKIDSNVAKINGKNKNLTTPALMHKNRTYVPLRFVSENFDGKVTYNHEAQSIDVTYASSVLPSPTPPPVNAGKPYTLHINNKKVQMTEPAIVRQHRTYIPAKYFYTYIENSSSQWIDEDTLELQLGGLIFTFTDGEGTILIDQVPVETEFSPFIQDGQMYLPVSFIIKTLGGNLSQPSGTTVMHLYLNDMMFESAFLEKIEGALPVPTQVPEAELEGTRSLLISDNPETLTHTVLPTIPATLSQQKVASIDEKNEHRIFGWHLNQLRIDVEIGITIENRSETSTLTVIESAGTTKTSSNSWVNYDVGLPIADQLLNGKLKKNNQQGTTIEPGETLLIESYDLDRNNILGFLHDVTIESSDHEADYVIRTVIDKEKERLTDIHTEQVQVNKYAAHPRGVWPSSVIQTTLPEYVTGSSMKGYSLSNGKTDHLLTAENSLSTENGAIGNPGHFGMTYHISVPLVNDGNRTEVIRLKATGRGGFYSGAMKINDEVHLIPTLKPNQDYVKLLDYHLEPGSETLEIKLMHAGGAALPVAMYIETVK